MTVLCGKQRDVGWICNLAAAAVMTQDGKLSQNQIRTNCVSLLKVFSGFLQKFILDKMCCKSFKIQSNISPVQTTVALFVYSAWFSESNFVVPAYYKHNNDLSHWQLSTDLPPCANNIYQKATKGCLNKPLALQLSDRLLKTKQHYIRCMQAQANSNWGLEIKISCSCLWF